jgi:hypothetical protein
MRAEFFQLFIESETGRLGRDFKKHAAGFTEINRMKIGAIDDWRDIVAKIDQMFAPLELFVLILCAKRDVMHRPRSDAAHSRIGQTKQVNDSARRRLIRRGKPKPVS